MDNQLPAPSLMLFSFGYWGWGNATGQLAQAFDAVEASRGHAPPLFADIRISRSVRARGFEGATFETIVGKDRYRWIDALGNRGIVDGGAMRIKDPTAAETLLELAVQCSAENRRVVFFCACRLPACCHRSVVSGLVIEVAQRKRLRLVVDEWPGGAPAASASTVELPAPSVDKLKRGGKSIPLGPGSALASAAALPHYSLVAVRAKGSTRWPSWQLMSGPARYRKADGWYLPVHHVFDGEPPEAVYAQVMQARERDGFVARATQAR